MWVYYSMDAWTPERVLCEARELLGAAKFEESSGELWLQMEKMLRRLNAGVPIDKVVREEWGRYYLAETEQGGRARRRPHRRTGTVGDREIEPRRVRRKW